VRFFSFSSYLTLQAFLWTIAADLLCHLVVLFPFFFSNLFPPTNIYATFSLFLPCVLGLMLVFFPLFVTVLYVQPLYLAQNPPNLLPSLTWSSFQNSRFCHRPDLPLFQSEFPPFFFFFCFFGTSFFLVLSFDRIVLFFNASVFSAFTPPSKPDLLIFWPSS